MSTVMIQAKDGEPREIELEFIKYSRTIEQMLDILESSDPDEVISLPGVLDSILIQVIEWLKYCHYNSSPAKTQEIEKDLEEWKHQFLQKNSEILIDLLKAANYLDIKNLLDAISEQLANMIIREIPEVIRAKFGIEDDLPRERKDEIRRENFLCGVPGIN